MKLELGAGHRPTRGYLHNDLNPGRDIECVGDAWMLDFADNSLDEVLAIAFIEHLTYDQARDTFRNVYRMLKVGGLFLFDVPDYPRWVEYYLGHLKGNSVPISMDHVRRTLFGWGRFPGDSHLYGWDRKHLAETLREVGFRHVVWGPEPFAERTYRNRFQDPVDAHLYVMAHRTAT